MKKQLLKKLAAFIVTAIIFSVNAHAQIVYTDVNPDSVLTCTTTSGGACSTMYQLDLNTDGIADFQLVKYYGFGFRQSSNSYVSVTPLGFNRVANTTTNIGGTFNLICASALANGDSIQNNSWYSTSLMLEQKLVQGLVFTFTCHNWNAVTDKYLGLRLRVGSNTYYGWVRLDVGLNGASFTVKDYAYNSIPNQLILAGQTAATGLMENNFASSSNLYPNPAKDHFTIDLGRTIQKLDVTIIDLSGKAIYTSTTNEANKLEVNTAEFAEGIYMVKIMSGDYTLTKKLIIQK